MKRFVLFLPVVLVLSGCAQVFDGNLFTSVDTPPALSASSFSNASVSDIQAMMADDSFYTRLQANPSALAAAQTALATDFTSVTGGSSAAVKATAVDAAQTYILVTAYGSDAGAVVTEAITQATNLVSGGSPATAIAALVDGKSAAEIKTILTNFLDISTALDKMQVASADGTSHVDSNLFFAGSASEGDLAQIALVAAAVKAMANDVSGAAGDGYTAGDLTTLASQLAAGTAPTSAATGTKSMTDLSNALGGTVTTANSFAYLNAVTGMLPF